VEKVGEIVRKGRWSDKHIPGKGGEEKIESIFGFKSLPIHRKCAIVGPDRTSGKHAERMGKATLKGAPGVDIYSFFEDCVNYFRNAI
jgi:hypothetical protein